MILPRQTSMPLPRSPPPEPRAPITTVDFHSADVVIRWVECNDEHDVRIISVEKGSRAAIQECPPIDSNKAFDGTGKLSRCIRRLGACLVCVVKGAV